MFADGRLLWLVLSRPMLFVSVLSISAASRSGRDHHHFRSVIGRYLATEHRDGSTNVSATAHRKSGIALIELSDEMRVYSLVDAVPCRGHPVLVDERPAAPVRRREPEEARPPDGRLKDRRSINWSCLNEERLEIDPAISSFRAIFLLVAFFLPLSTRCDTKVKVLTRPLRLRRVPSPPLPGPCPKVANLSKTEAEGHSLLLLLPFSKLGSLVFPSPLPASPRL